MSSQPTLQPTMTVRLCHLYPDLMNIYADRGNIAVFRQRLAWRGYGLEITNASVGDSIEADAHDLYYLGGGQDRDQDLVADDLAHKAEVLRDAADHGAAQLYVCGGIQLAGHSYVASNGERLGGVSVLDLETAAGQTRLIGDLVIEATIEGTTRQIVGYENHAGRTTLGPTCTALGKVKTGHGNNDTDGTEGATRDHVIATYLHGPLLPKNPWVADTLLVWALEHRYGAGIELASLDDALEDRAHAAAVERAGVAR